MCAHELFKRFYLMNKEKKDVKSVRYSYHR